VRRQGYRRVALPLVLIISLVLAACQGSAEETTTTSDTPVESTTTTAAGGEETTTTAAPADDGVLRIATGDEFECFDPSLCSSALPQTTLNHHVFSTLVQHIGDPMVLVPNLATSWEYSDPTTVTFELDPNATFHNGDPVTADDVVYSFEEYAKEDSVRVSYVAAITSVTADGPNTVTFTTDGPRTDLMGNLARAFIMPQDARDAVGPDAFGQAPIGSGPYMFESQDGSGVVLTANPDWFQGAVQPERIELVTTTDPATRAALLQSGEVDVIDGVALEAIDSLEAGGDVEVISLPGARTIMYTFNTTQPPFDDVRVRLALNYAVDQQSMIDNVLQGRGTQIHGPWGPAWLGFDPDLETYDYDPDRARELLADAGYADGFNTTFQITDGNRMKDAELAQVIQAQLADVGVNVELQPMPSSNTNDNWKAGEFEGLTSVTWSLPGDPGGMVTYSFSNEFALAPDPELTELVDATQSLVDEDERAEALAELGRYVNEQALWLFTHAEDTLYAKQADVPWVPLPVSSGGATLWYWFP
jgi:peptide/nickel transport system substrate-binding protein